MKNNATGIDLNGVHLGVSIEGVQTGIREVGIVGDKLVQGGVNRWGNDAFEHLGSLLLPNNLSALDKQGNQSSFLPAWALWGKIKSNKSWEDKSSSHDATTVGGIIDEVLKTYGNGISYSGKSALVIDDDLSSEAQERLAQFIRIRGLNLVLLPRSVAIFLAWAKDVAPGEKRKLGGKKAVVINLRVDGMNAIEIEMDWLQSNWSKKAKDSKPDQGYLIPCLKKRDKRIVGEYRYLPLDIEALHDMNFPGVDPDSKLWHAWAQLIKDRVLPKEKEEFPTLAFGDSGWVTRTKKTNSNNHKDLKSMWHHFLGQKISIPKSFSITDLEATFNQISNAIEPERIIIVDETYGLIGTEWRSIAKESFASLPDFSVAKPEVGAAIFASRLNQNLPTYYEELPDVKILAQVGKSRKRQEISLVDTESDYARGGKIYTNEPYDAILKPTGNITLNFLIEGEKKHKECSFIETPEEGVIVGLKVEVTASQGYGKIEFVPKEESDKRAYGSISIEWDELTDGHIEIEDDYNSPPVSQISPDGFKFIQWYRGYTPGPEETVEAIESLTVAKKWDALSEKEKIKKLKTVHEGCRNGVSLGSDSFSGIQVLIEQGKLTDGDFLNTWKKLGGVIKEGIDKENDHESKLSDFLVRAGSHFWAETPDNVREVILHNFDRENPGVQFIEAAGRAFHRRDEVECFIRRFLSEFDREGLRLKNNWYKALSFILRTSTDIADWVDVESVGKISEALRIRVASESSKLRKALPKGFRYCLLCSLYFLRMREKVNGEQLFNLKVPVAEKKPHHLLAEELMKCCVLSWLILPWVPQGAYLGEMEEPSKEVDSQFISLFLWPEELPVYSEEILSQRITELKDLGVFDEGEDKKKLIRKFTKAGLVVRNDQVMISELKAEYDLFRGGQAKSALQPSIARFLLGKAGGSDIRLIEKGADQAV